MIILLYKIKSIILKFDTIIMNTINNFLFYKKLNFIHIDIELVNIKHVYNKTFD